MTEIAGVLSNTVFNKSNHSVDKNNHNIILWVFFFLLGQLKTMYMLYFTDWNDRPSLSVAVDQESPSTY